MATFSWAVSFGPLVSAHICSWARFTKLWTRLGFNRLRIGLLFLFGLIHGEVCQASQLDTGCYVDQQDIVV